MVENVNTALDLQAHSDEVCSFILSFLCLLKKDLLILVYAYEYFPPCMRAHHVCAWCPERPEKGTGSSRTGEEDGFELVSGSWESTGVTVSALNC